MHEVVVERLKEIMGLMTTPLFLRVTEVTRQTEAHSKKYIK